ncbi:MAG TPA: hypothetical protein VK629_13315 [Steroidobacteraceae bacterium]|nr:hypothetical protein [Steroidobacteraceae bacterium]
MQRNKQSEPQFVLSCGREQLPLASVLANGRPVANGHELAHVVQQRHCELVLAFIAASGSQAISPFRTADGLKAEAAIIDSKSPGVRISLTKFKDSAGGGTAAHYFPGNTKYTTVKLSR